jgi:F-type H+-transporting ATPase subunit f
MADRACCLVLFVAKRRRSRQRPRDGSSNASDSQQLPHTLGNNNASLPRSSPAGWYRATKGCFSNPPRTFSRREQGFGDVDSCSVSSAQTGGQGGSLTPLVDFYSKLPKGPAAQTRFGGLKAKYFSGKNASGAPILATILGIFAIGYTIDYQSASHHHIRTRSLPL